MEPIQSENLAVRLGARVRYPLADSLLRLYRRRGSVTSVGGRRGYTYLLGPEANQFVFARSGSFRWGRALDFLRPVDGETSMLLSDGDDHRRRRRLVEPGLHHRRIADHVPTMAANADAVIDQWHPGEEHDAFAQFRAAIRRTTLDTIFGPSLASDAQWLGEDLQVMIDLCDALPQVVGTRRRLRTPLWRRAMASRDRVDARIHAEIARVRGLGAGAEASIMDTLVHGRDGDGAGLADEEIRDQAVTLIVAGYETTSALLGWALHAMLAQPEVWARAAEEVATVVGDAPPTAGQVRAMPYLNGVVSEALRLWAPVVVLARWLAEPISFAGKDIQPGRSVVISPYLTHRLPELWPEPLEFRPQRWIDGDALHRKPKPYEYLPFGGGAHRCVGAAMAVTEVAVMLARILARTDISLVPQRIRPRSMVTMKPRDGVRIRVQSVR